jgi:LysR family transcriptional regulator, hydrogen peroxide-inducible genes activator
MEMHQLRYVVALARARNFSRAAELCHVSQPSLSQQVQKLEDELGERLFERTRRDARLTVAGEAFLRRAAAILEEVEAARREISEVQDLKTGTLRLGVLPTIAPYLLPGLMARFGPKYPGLEIIVQEETTAQLTRQVLACDLDLALVSDPLEERGLQTRELFDEELLLALPPNHRLVDRVDISLEDLENERFILMKEGHCLGDQVLSFCHRRDFRPQISFRSAQLETLQALVGAGLGLSLIPEMAVQRAGKDRPVYRGLQGFKPRRKILAVWLKQRTMRRAAREFLEGIRPL